MQTFCYGYAEGTSALTSWQLWWSHLNWAILNSKTEYVWGMWLCPYTLNIGCNMKCSHGGLFLSSVQRMNEKISILLTDLFCGPMLSPPLDHYPHQSYGRVEAERSKALPLPRLPSVQKQCRKVQTSERSSLCLLCYLDSQPEYLFWVSGFPISKTDKE